MLNVAGNAGICFMYIPLLMTLSPSTLPGGIPGPVREIRNAATGTEMAAGGPQVTQPQWTAGQLMDPDQLVKILLDAKRPKPLVIYIGPSILFRSGRISSARYAGPAAQAPALEALQQQLQSLPSESEIVLYCGCCPWEHCPNIGPAFSMIQKMGFKNARILHLPRSFKEDWIDRGLPTHRAPAPGK